MAANSTMHGQDEFDRDVAAIRADFDEIDQLLAEMVADFFKPRPKTPSARVLHNDKPLDR